MSRGISTPPAGTPERRERRPGRRDDDVVRVGQFGRALVTLVAVACMSMIGWMLLQIHNIDLAVNKIHIQQLHLDTRITSCQHDLRSLEQGHTQFDNQP